MFPHSGLAAASPRILIVDDDRDAAQEMGAMLEHAGLAARIVNDPASAYDAVIEDPDIRLVITDLCMPGLTGEELIRRLERDLPHRGLNFIVVSGEATLEQAIDAFYLPVHAVLHKPVRGAELRLRARACIAGIRPGPRLPPEAVTAPREPHRADGELQGLRDAVIAHMAFNRRRNLVLGAPCEIDPVWMMILFLIKSELDGIEVTVSSLVHASGLPHTTGLRQVRFLEEAGIIGVIQAERDKRVKICSLNRSARDRIAALLTGTP